MGIFSGPSRPKASIPLRPLEIMVEITALAGVIMTLMLFFYYWPKMPDAGAAVPGEIRTGVNRANMLIALTAIPVAAYVAITAMGLFPRWFNYPVMITEDNAAREYRLAANMLRCVKAELAICMLIIVWLFGRIAMGEKVSVSPLYIPIAICILAVTITYFVYQMFRQK